MVDPRVSGGGLRERERLCVRAADQLQAGGCGTWRCPVLREQRGDLQGGMGLDAEEDVSEVGDGVDAVHLEDGDATLFARRSPPRHRQDLPFRPRLQ